MIQPVPLWAAEPSRFAGWSRAAALAILASLTVALFVAARADGGSGEVAGDAALYAGAVDAMRHGGEYYQAVAAALRGGVEPAGSLAFPPPPLGVVAAALPDAALSVLLAALAGASVIAWWPVLARSLRRPAARWVAMLLLGAGLAPYLAPVVLLVPEVWAGLFVSLSLARWAHGARADAAALGLCAALLREVAGVYLLVMLAFALAARARREALGWTAALGAFALALLAHRRAVAEVLGPLVGAAEAGVTGLGPLVAASPVAVAPAALPVIALALFGWLACRGGAGPRLAATIGGVAGLAALRPEIGGDWGYLVAAPLLTGLAFAPDGVRDLIHAASLMRRRITVKRVAR